MPNMFEPINVRNLVDVYCLSDIVCLDLLQSHYNAYKVNKQT